MRKFGLILLVLALLTGWAQAEGFSLLEERIAQVEEGNADAMGHLGRMYLKGEEVEKNVPLALEWLQKGIENGSYRSYFWLGMVYYQGLEVERDYDKAYELISTAATGWPLVKNIMEWMFYEGRPVMLIDEVRAAAKAGDAEAQYELGRLYEISLEVDKDIDEAVKWLTLAAEQDYIPAQKALSNIHEGWGPGDSEKKYLDAAKAVYWLERAATLGDIHAQFSLGMLYTRDNETFTPNFELARKWYLKAGQNGNMGAYSMLAYHSGIHTKQDYTEALRLFLLDAEAGDASAMQMVADMYEAGQGVDANSEEALKWRRKAAPLMVATAQYSLGDIYFPNDRKPYFHDKLAERWRNLALDEPGLGAIHVLANYYEQRIPVVKDMAEAVRWYKLAAQNGDEQAAQLLGRMYSVQADYYGLEVDYAEAAKWFALGAAKNDVYSLYYLGQQYQKGLGVPRDLVQAYVLTAKAYINGRDYSEYNVFRHVLHRVLPEMMTGPELVRARNILAKDGIPPEKYLRASL